MCLARARAHTHTHTHKRTHTHTHYTMQIAPVSDATGHSNTPTYKYTCTHSRTRARTHARSHARTHVQNTIMHMWCMHREGLVESYEALYDPTHAYLPYTYLMHMQMLLHCFRMCRDLPALTTRRCNQVFNVGMQINSFQGVFAVDFQDS